MVGLFETLHHPHLGRVLHVTVIDGIPALASPYFEPGNVMQYLASNPNANRIALVRSHIFVLVVFTKINAYVNRSHPSSTLCGICTTCVLCTDTFVLYVPIIKVALQRGTNLISGQHPHWGQSHRSVD